MIKTIRMNRLPDEDKSKDLAVRALGRELRPASETQDARRTCLASRILIACISRQQGHGIEMITPSVGTTTASLTETMTATSVSGHVATNRFMTYERINEAAGSTNEKSQAGARVVPGRPGAPPE
jgi:hypothetical protein